VAFGIISTRKAIIALSFASYYFICITCAINPEYHGYPCYYSSKYDYKHTMYIHKITKASDDNGRGGRAVTATPASRKLNNNIDAI